MEPDPVLDTTSTKDEQNMAVAAHLLSFCGYVFPFGNIIGPLVIYFIRKDTSTFVRKHAVEAVNFQISLTIYFFVSFILAFVLIGFLLMFILVIIHIVCAIKAAMAASKGLDYTYPITIRLMS